MKFARRLAYSVCLGFLFFGLALLIGFEEGKEIGTLSLIGTSIVLEAQPAAVASLPLRFHPFQGAMISVFGNLILLPVLVLTFDEIMNHWKWAKRRLHKAEVWSEKYGKYGVWILVPFSPVLGAYVCIAIGYIMRWKRHFVLSSVMIGMVLSSFLITYGGESVVRLIRPFV